MTRWLSTFLWQRGGFVLVVALPIYLWLAAPSIADGDNAEFSTLAVTGGASHPPGYPLYVLYLRAMSWLPGSAAHAASLATALLGAATLLVLHAACRAWGARPGAASVAVALFAGSPIALRLHTSAEVFALNGLVAATIVLLSAREGPLRGAKRTIVLAFVAGLGLANHQTCVLVAPLGLLGAIRGIREARTSSIVTIGAAIAALAVGLSPYLMLFGPETPASWARASSASELLAYFQREIYGGVGSFAANAGTVDRVANIGALLSSLGRAFLWLPMFLGIGTLVVRCVRRGDGETRLAWVLLAVSVALAGPLLVARFNLYPSGAELVICHRFHLLSIVLLVVPVAIGLDAVARWLASRTHLPDRPALREGAAVAVLATTIALSLPYVQAMHSPAVEKSVVNILRSLPENAVLIGTGDDLYFGSNYIQQARGIRKDVIFIGWTITTLPWYRARLAARGVAIDPYAPSEELPSIRVARQVFASGRPLFVELSVPNIARMFPSYPYGAVIRVLPPGGSVPSLGEIVEINKRLFAAFDLAYPAPPANAYYGVLAQERYARTWDLLATSLAKAGRPDDAAAARALVLQLMPPGYFGTRTP